jgi:hypothetical protein
MNVRMVSVVAAAMTYSTLTAAATHVLFMAREVRFWQVDRGPCCQSMRQFHRPRLEVSAMAHLLLLLWPTDSNTSRILLDQSADRLGSAPHLNSNAATACRVQERTQSLFAKRLLP